jgi:MFS family permease
MTVLPGEQPTAPDVRELADPRPPTLKSLGLRGLFVTLPLAILSFSIFWGGVQGVLLPIQVQAIDREGQDGALALIIGMGAIASMVAAPIAGTLTDRTRSRLGGRAPWMIFGALATFALAIALAFATSIAAMAIIIVAIQFTTALILTPVSAYIPDRVPVIKRGMFSAVFGLAQLVGNVVGQSVGAAFSTTLVIGYLVVGGLLAALVVLFALTNVRSNVGEPRLPVSIRAILQTFWVNPIKHPNFAWTFFGRFLLFTGYFPLWTFMLYLLQDFIGLGEDAVGAIPTMGLANLVGSIIGTAVAGFAVQKLKRTKPVIFAASLIIIVALAVPFLAPSLTSMIIYSAVAGFGMGAFISVDFVLITLVLPDAENTGKDLGIINVTTTLPQTIGVTIGSLAIAAFGTYAALLPFGIIATALGAVLLFFIRGVK